MGKTVVIGGGVIGLLCAYELRQRGREVIVLDKGEFGRGASSGNAGWVTPSLSGPVPAPGIVAESLKWMLRPDSPLYVRPSAVPRMTRWLIAFWRHCNAEAYRRGRAALAQLNRTTLKDFDSLAARGLQFEMHSKGLLYVFRTRSAMEEMLLDEEEWTASGASPPVIMDRSQAQEFEPALRPDIEGALFVESERHVRPESLLQSVQQWLQENGVDLRSHTKVVDFAFRDGRVVGVRTADGLIDCDQVLVATGAEASFLASQAGFQLPMQAGKGYSMTIENPKLKLGHSMYLVEGRVALTPFDGALRVAGTMELSGVNTTFYEKRLEGIKKSTDRYLKDWQAGDAVENWVGMRPMLPDGLPALGRAPSISNLFIASGHAMLGVTLGPTTAVIMADLMTKGTTHVDLTPFDPARFSN